MRSPATGTDPDPSSPGEARTGAGTGEGRILLPHRPGTLARLELDPQRTPSEPAADGLIALPPERLRPDALRQHFVSPPVNWEAELQSDRIILPNAPRQLRPASVLVPIIDRRSGPVVLLTLRTKSLREHSGQVAFPGGRAEPQDRSLVQTALREAQEEVGLDPRLVEVIGQMPDYLTGTGYRVTPVVGLVAREAVLRPEPGEVAAAFEVPLAFLMDPGNHRRHRYDLDGVRRSFLAMPWGPPGQEPYFIWGATAAMLRNLYHFLRAD